ncbi:hypothetical protein [Actinoplanes sp. HUAS TT8]|uniref:hypothetical protein n=1 Tax=Actinoplanes sp. HUAS TT8 TaxID=3447453 RepID=UPI003F5213AD
MGAFAPFSGNAAAPLPINAELSGGGSTTLVVDLSAAPAGTKPTIAVNIDGTPQKAELVPVVSADLATSIVVDASTAGAGSRPSWLSAAARFSLAAPPRARTVVIADRRPATLVTGPLRGPTGVVRALDTIHSTGDRDTEAALTLATEQFSGTDVGRRVTLLYTTAEGVPGLTAAQLAARFRSAGILLVVVGASDPDRYWSSATAETGGFFAPAGSPVVVSALDQVETTLSARYLVRFPSPARLPAHVSVSVRTGDVILSTSTTLGEPPPAPSPRTQQYWLLAASTAAILLTFLLLTLRSRRRPRPAPAAPTSPYAVLLGAPPLPQPLSPTTPPPGSPQPVRMRPHPRGQSPVPPQNNRPHPD